MSAIISGLELFFLSKNIISDMEVFCFFPFGCFIYILHLKRTKDD